MAHITDSATSPNDLLDKIRIWLISRGWTANRWQTWTGGYDLCISKGTLYLNFRSYNNVVPWNGTYTLGYGIVFGISTEFNSANDTIAQVGLPKSGNTTYGAATNTGAGPFTSHQFFDDGNENYLLMIERSPGVWRSICFGLSLDKSGAGSWVGGQYFGGWEINSQHGSNADNGSAWGNRPPMTNSDLQGAHAYVRADVDTYQGNWIFLMEDPPASAAAGTGCVAAENDLGCDWQSVPKYADYFNGRLFNVQDQRCVLLPFMIFAARDLGGASFLGTVPSIACSNISLTVGQDIVVGSEVWRQFNGFFVKVVE